MPQLYPETLTAQQRGLSPLLQRTRKAIPKPRAVLHPLALSQGGLRLHQRWFHLAWWMPAKKGYSRATKGRRGGSGCFLRTLWRAYQKAR